MPGQDGVGPLPRVRLVCISSCRAASSVEGDQNQAQDPPHETQQFLLIGSGRGPIEPLKRVISTCLKETCEIRLAVTRTRNKKNWRIQCAEVNLYQQDLA